MASTSEYNIHPQKVIVYRNNPGQTVLAVVITPAVVVSASWLYNFFLVFHLAACIGPFN